MDRVTKIALIELLIVKLREKGSWCGETHIQKSLYFLQGFNDVPTDFDFILYKHGPFSFDLRDELSAMRADGLLKLQSINNYGPRLELTENGKEFLAKYATKVEKFKVSIEKVVQFIGDKKVDGLEKLATASFVLKMNEKDLDGFSPEEYINDLKPHISKEEAEASISEVKEMFNI